MTATPAAIVFGTTPAIVPGVVLAADIGERDVQSHDRKFWGVFGESSIFGQAGKRELLFQVLIYDLSGTPLFDTARKLSFYIDHDLGDSFIGTTGDLIPISPAFRGDVNVSSGTYTGYGKYQDTRFDGARIIDGPKHDDAGTVGGNWWTEVVMKFTQLGI